MSLVVEHLTARYGERTILSDVDLQPLAAGQVVSLIGPNGAGKDHLDARRRGPDARLWVGSCWTGWT